MSHRSRVQRFKIRTGNGQPRPTFNRRPPSRSPVKAIVDTGDENLGAVMGLENVITLPLIVSAKGRLYPHARVLVTRERGSRPGVACDCLIDTGSNRSAVSAKIAVLIGLEETGTVPACGFHDAHPVDVSQRRAAFRLLHQREGDAPLETDTLDVGTVSATIGVDAVLGMDVLSRCVLVVNGPDKTFTLAY